MSRPPFRRTFTIHDIPQTREQNELSESAYTELSEIKHEISTSPKLRRKQSKRLIKKIENVSPKVKSHSFQKDLTDVSEMLKDKSRYRKTRMRIEELIKQGDVVPTLGEIISEICKTEDLPTIVEYAVSQSPDSWNKTNVRCLLYSRGRVRPRAMMTSYLISLELLKNETSDTVLRTDNLLTKLLVAWMPKIEFKSKMLKNYLRTCKRILLEIFRHLSTENIDYPQLLQKQIIDANLQGKGTPVVLINLVLRFYIPQFRQQYPYNPEMIGRICMTIQAFVNGHSPQKIRDDLILLNASKKLKKEFIRVQGLFTNDTVEKKSKENS